MATVTKSPLTTKHLRFNLRFNVSEIDVPKIILYVTSEKNAEGAIFTEWRNGKAFKVIPEHTYSVYR